ncbi:MAG: carbon starvation CstA family protein [Bacteroidaceae bacterium]|nr:carbon starvation CstA family protein [Bacteroidaceae bacterium]
MITFLICLTALVVAYFTYGRYLEKVCEVNPDNPVPSKTHYDGVDYIPLPRWRIFLIQLLNIAGLGPIFGALLGAAYGPVAFLWITLGGIFIGAMHDFVAGVISLKNNGLSLPEIIGKYMGEGTRRFMRIAALLLMVLVGAVFMSQPAELIAANVSLPILEGAMSSTMTWEVFVVIMLILAYYILATIMPIDKIIGRIYPVFGLAVLVMAFGILVVLLFNSDRYAIPELTSLSNCIADAEKFPIVPMLFTTIACGAISGFHATQSPMMARCMTNEIQSRSVFYGAMIAESIIALIWSAIAMAFWGGAEGLNNAIAEYGGSAARMVNTISVETLGSFVAPFVIIGVVACAITSGDTAFRSARLIAADMLGISQAGLTKRVLVSLPLFMLGVFIIFALPFQTIWSYFAWMNQTLATITLWCITVYLAKHRKPIVIGFVPALFMTYVCSSYIFISPMMVGMENRVVAYVLGGVLSVLIGVAILFQFRKGDK